MRHSIRFKFLFLIVASLILLVACNNQVKISPYADVCIGTFEDYAYQAPDREVKKSSPPEPWVKVENLPENANLIYKYLDIEAIRKVNNQTEIWLKIPDSNVYFDSESEKYQYFIYIVETKKWRTLSARIENTNAFAMKLFVSSDGTMWGQNFWDIHKFSGNVSSPDQYPVLSKYNETKQEFEFDTTMRSIPAFWLSPDPLAYWDRVVLASDDVFWLFVHNEAVYSYDPKMQNLQKHVEIPNLVIREAALSHDENIYLRVENDIAFEIRKGDYYVLSAKTGNLEVVETPTGKWPSPNGILVDHLGNLWLSAVGWRSEDGQWNMIYPFPSRYFWNIEVEGNSRWSTPKIIMESTDSRLWFEKEEGMAWLDPKSMQGCWFTTTSTNILEDSEKNLWMVADQSLYKYSLKP